MSEALLIKKFFFPQTLHEKPEGHRPVPPNYTLPISVIKYGLKFLSSEDKKSTRTSVNSHLMSVGINLFPVMDISF